MCRCECLYAKIEIHTSLVKSVANGLIKNGAMDKFVVRNPKQSKTETELTGDEPSCSDEGMKQQVLKRKFRAEWLRLFDWLQEKDGCAFCVACSKTVINHSSHLKAHQKTAIHVQSYEARKKQFTLDKFYDTEQQKQQQQVRNAELTLVMFCITHNLPFLLMDFLPALLVECCPESAIAKLIKCGRTKSTAITECISKQASEQIFSVLRSKKFSLIVDETTDVSMNKCLVLVARYVDAARIVQDRCIALLELTKADAVSIYKAIKNFFCLNKIPLENLIGLATDGANVMAGDVGGLKTLLNKDVNFFYMKCTCHSLHLCSSYASKHLPKNVESLCRNIYSFFSHSPKRITELQEFQEYCAVKAHKILGICNTRWLSLEGVVLRIVEQWDCLRLYFISFYYEVNGIQTARLAEEMSAKMKCYFLFLSYILPIINNLNKEFQAQSSRLPYLYTSMKSNFLLIQSNFFKQELLNNDNFKFKDKCNHKPVSNIFIGTKAEIFMKSHLCSAEIIEVKMKVLSFYIEFLEQLEARFDFNREDIKMLQIITPSKDLSTEDLPILPLVLKFAYLVDCDPDYITTQWNLLRLSELNLSVDMDLEIFWTKVDSIKNGLNQKSFAELCNFIFHIISLPHSSAAAERKFSSLSLIKTKLRNKLTIDNIHNIMLCKELISNKEPHYIWSAKKDFKGK